MVLLARSHGIEPVLITAPTSHEGEGSRRSSRGWMKSLADLVPLHK